MGFFCLFVFVICVVFKILFLYLSVQVYVGALGGQLEFRLLGVGTELRSFGTWVLWESTTINP